MIRWLAFIAGIVLIAAGAVPLCAQTPHPPVCLVLVSGTSLNDWKKASGSPTLQRLLENGSIAVLNVRSARNATEDLGPSASSAAISLTAGARCTASPDASELDMAFAPSRFGPGESMQDILQRRTGIMAPQNSLVDISWPLLLHENGKLGYKASPGNLVVRLRRAGIRTCAYEAIPTGETPGARTVAGSGSQAYVSAGPEAFLAGLADGYVVQGSPLGQGVPSPNTFWIVDLGSNINQEEDLLSQITAKINAAHGTLIVASLYTNHAEYAAGNRLAPVLIYGSQWSKGELYSPSTHTRGLVILSDLAPTIASSFGLPTSGFLYGRPLSSIASAHPISTTAKIEGRANAQRSAMRLLPAAAVVMGLLWALLACLTFLRKLPKELWLYVPLLMLLLVVSPSVPIAAISEVILSPVLILCARRFGNWQMLTITSSFTLLLILTSFAHGSWLMHRSLIGYSVIEGARYYGIGNEAMGILFGSSLLTALLICQRYGRRASIPILMLFILIVAVLGLPSAGAKVGGVLVGVGTFCVFGLRWMGQKVRLVEAAGMAVLTIAALAVFVLIDRHGGSAHSSHLGQLWDNTANGQTSDLIDTMLRKGKVELRLLYHSCWSVALAGGIAAVFATRKESEDRAAQAFQGASLAAIVLTLLLNDAGAVACSLMLPYLAVGGAYAKSPTTESAPGS